MVTDHKQYLLPFFKNGREVNSERCEKISSHAFKMIQDYLSTLTASLRSLGIYFLYQ